MIAKDDLLTNFTDAGLKMCVGEFGQKMHVASIIQGINSRVNHKQAQGSKGPLDSLTREGDGMRLPHHRSRTTPSRPIRREYEDQWAHQRE